MVHGPAECFDQSRHRSFGLQLLLAGGIILGLVLAARQVTVVPAQTELDAVQALEKRGCEIQWCVPPDEIETPFGTYRRSWVTGILGPRYFSTIGQVRIRGATEEDLTRYFAQLREYEKVIASLRGTEVTDASVKGFARLPRLREVDLGLTRVTDASVAQLAAAADLELLSLEHTRVTDQAVKSLAAMPRLRQLNLEGTLVSDHGIQRLKAAKPKLTVTWATAPSESERAAAAEMDSQRQVVVRAARLPSGQTFYAAVLTGYFPSSEFADRLSTRDKTMAQALRELHRLPHLGRLQLPFVSSLGEKEVNELARFPMLHALHLYGSWLDEGVVDELARIHSLHELYLDGVTVCGGPEALAQFRNLRKLALRRLTCYGPRMTVGWRPLLAYDSVASPFIGYGYRDARIIENPLVVFPAARSFGPPPPLPPPFWGPVYGTHSRTRDPANGEWLEPLAALPNLESLDLSETLVAPAALLKLQAAAKLQELTLLGVPFGADDEKKLRQALPKAEIRTGPSDAQQPPLFGSDDESAKRFL